MKLGKHIDLDELLQKHPLIGFVNGCLQFPAGGGGHLGGQNHQKKTLSESKRSGQIKITTENPQNI